MGANVKSHPRNLPIEIAHRSKGIVEGSIAFREDHVWPVILAPDLHMCLPEPGIAAAIHGRGHEHSQQQFLLCHVQMGGLTQRVCGGGY
jgi:hypothetical protein